MNDLKQTGGTCGGHAASPDGVQHLLGAGHALALVLGTALTPAMALDFSSQQAIDPAVELDPFVEAMLRLVYPAVISGNGETAGFLRFVSSGDSSAVESYLWDGTTATLLDGAGTAVVVGLSYDGEMAVGSQVRVGSGGLRPAAIHFWTNRPKTRLL